MKHFLFLQQIKLFMNLYSSATGSKGKKNYLKESKQLLSWWDLSSYGHEIFISEILHFKRNGLYIRATINILFITNEELEDSLWTPVLEKILF